LFERFVLLQQQQTALESASLAAARDLGKIVVNDPHFGYISLSDYPPCGKATIARDGEPLPVLSINTVLGTARVETIVAHALGNPELCALAKKDVDAAHDAARLLQDTLSASLDPLNKNPARDLDGRIIKPFEHACNLYLANLPAAEGSTNLNLKDFHIALGWLRDGSSTVTPVPQPIDMADVPEAAQIKSKYKAFVDIPTCGESFCFAGVGEQPALVDSHRFMRQDGKRLSSIIQIESNLAVVKHGLMWQSTESIHSVACAQSGALAESSTPGALLLSFPDGYPPGIKSIRDLFTDRQLNSNLVAVQTVRDGDFPDESTAHLVAKESAGSSGTTIAALFSDGFYDWLRTAHCRPRIDSVLQVVDSYFRDSARCGSGTQSFPLFVYEFDKEGKVVVTNHREIPFLAQTVLENQVYALSFQAINTGTSTWTMSFRDQVRSLGTIYGGKHAGQSMPGDPVNWCDLARYDGGLEQAQMKRKGVALGIMPVGDAAPGDGIALGTAFFNKLNGTNLSAQPRKNYYGGGLAVEFRLSSSTNN
jgi:hypothetical protein